MSYFYSSTVGKKFWMSLSGLFLISFLAVHLTANLMLIFDDSGELFNRVVHFMGTNPIIKIMEPVLAVGFLFHIFLATILTLRNQTTRTVKYKVEKRGHTSSWASRNMYVLGTIVIVFLLLHLANFWYKFKFGELPAVNYDGVEMENAYGLVSGLFSIWWYDVIYIIGALALGYHISHGFWSSFQTIGWSNEHWRFKIFTPLAYAYAILIAVGFSIIPLFFLMLK
jgi:succinate dehydrogenase / fumarate reductase cytochrome b subunit